MAPVYREAGRNLHLAKSADKDCIYLLGRVLEWKRLADAVELKDTITQMLEEFRGSRQFLAQLRGFYQKEIVAGGSPDADAASAGWAVFSAVSTAPWATRATASFRSCALIWSMRS